MDAIKDSGVSNKEVEDDQFEQDAQVKGAKSLHKMSGRNDGSC